jgi:signal transduction histidine kinase
VPLIEETLLLLERDATAAGKYRFDRHFTVRSLRARADRDALKQVFWNLCNNALRAMPTGGTLSIGIEADETWVRINIRDTGIGLDARELARIFEPFQSGFSGGTGLGLAIVYQILQAHQGRIRVEAQKGKGAEFIVEVPRSTRTRTTPRREKFEPAEELRPVGKG